MSEQPPAGSSDSSDSSGTSGPSGPSGSSLVPVVQPLPPTNGYAIACLGLGIVSLMGCSFVTGIPAMVLSRVARRDIAAHPGETTGQDLATIGFALGAVATAIGALVVVGLLILGTLGLFVFDFCGGGKC
ncbi:DUF4190 domain-containing protein [Nocardioides lijunqiniae]|uniref:DUF4190 domain-containing protein n=1 Tax=Nocardioides lijunqiniae TaxID=2760832 RepID=UPI001878BAAD|nr:DUF4190 domain-containing protein [Nocardioides lijunqiniae]